jgi:hypothetical protein
MNMTKLEFSTVVASLLLAGTLGACAMDGADEATGGDENDPAAETDHSVPISEIPEGAAVITLNDEAPPGEVASGPAGGARDAHCAWYEVCGVVHNRSGGTLQLSRDSASHLTCQARGPYRDLGDGGNSDAFWEDTDCVRSHYAWIVTNGRAYAPNDWIRVWTPKWIY